MILSRNMLRAVPLLSLLWSTAMASLIQVKMNEMECAGIYSKSDWGGSVDPYIEVKITDAKSNKDDDWIALVIFEYRNVELLGADIPNDPKKKYVCDDAAIASNLCDKEHHGEFIVSKSSNSTSYGKIVTKRLDFSNLETVKYNVEKTGFYCVSTYTSDKKSSYSGVAEFRNAFGHLAASQIPKLPFFGGAALAYALVFALWMFAYVQHRADILPVQNYITAICGFLVVEMIVIWGYYDYMNNGASKAGATVYLGIMSVLNSIRNAYTFFLLLIVCMGYGVVKPSLGSTMWKCQALAGVHFVFAVIYTVSSYVISPDKAGPIVMFMILPLSLTMTTFYVWILASLTSTIKYLEERKQAIKAHMYRTLWRLLLGSIIIIFAFFFINSLILTTKSTLDFITTSWKSRWFLLDGWLNVVYFVDFCIIAYIWRPSANNRRFAMSTQIAQDENEAQEFEIGSLRESMDEEERAGDDNDDDELERMTGTMPVFGNQEESSDRPPEYSQVGQQQQGGSGAVSHGSKDKRGQQSGEGETMFAVGDDDRSDDGYKWDDDEEDLLSSGDEGETQGLRKKGKKKDD
uniref:ARAD1B23342p n=1 Tax=Blastobotrys adeninivorans TaxID=409370 RepID=A0A060T7W3_BLAAD